MRSTHSPLFRPTYAEISLPNLENNAKWLSSLSRDFFCPMLKSNAYGHGDVEIGLRLSRLGFKTFGLALVEEACRLRAGGLQAEELLVFGCFERAGAEEILSQKLTPVIKLWSELELLESLLSPNAKLPIHIKFNSGMARLGFELHEASDVKAWLDRNSSKFELRGVCSHLSHGEDAGNTLGHSQKQLRAMRDLRDLFGGNVIYHLLNSPGAMSLWAHDRLKDYDLGFRPGIALYGVPPDVEFQTPEAQRKWETIPLKPVLRLRSGVVSYHHLQPGDSVSYGGAWVAERPSIVGVVPIGYADGFTRHFSNRGKMLFRGQRVPVVGKVCMDYTMVDLTDVLKDKFGEYAEEIVLIGQQGAEQLFAKEVAAWSDTISYEILTCVGRRVPRKYVD